MKDGKMKKVQMMVQPKLTRVERNRAERNTSRKINYEQQLVDILTEKSEHIDEDKNFLFSLVPGFKKIERWPEVLDEDGNAGNYEECKKNGVSATVCTTVMKSDYSEFFICFRKKNYNEYNVYQK